MGKGTYIVHMFILISKQIYDIRKLNELYHLFLMILKLGFLLLEKTKLFYTKESSSNNKHKFLYEHFGQLS